MTLQPAETISENLEGLLSENVDAAMEREQSAFDEVASPFERRLILFGAGGFGRYTLARLRRVGIEPVAFADNSAKLWGKSVDGLQVVAPEDAAGKFGEDAAFVVTIWNGQGPDRMADRIRQLRNLGCRKVIPAGLLFWKYPDAFLPYYSLDLPHKLLLRSAEVREVFEIWSDEASRREYVAQIAFRLFLNYDALGSPGAEESYFPPDLYHLSSHEVLIDCGAFDGDTIAAFVRLKDGDFMRLLAFEPDPLNWPKLQETLSALPAASRAKISSFQQAVGAGPGIVRFDSTGTNLSTMGSGAFSVECVSLDDVLNRTLQSTPPTIIKFDIEGAELGALSGVRQTIGRDTPLLAVSAYHRQSHLWEVPLAIAAASKRYRYFLRPHGVEGWDLVCYAVPPERLLA